MPIPNCNPPRPIVAAIVLLAVNTLLNNAPRALLVVTGILSGRIVQADIIFKVIDECVLWGFSIALLVFLWQGHNWARWLNLVLAVLNIGLAAYRIATALAAHTPIAAAIPAANAVLEIVALYLMFFSVGKSWYDRADQSTSAA